MRNLLSRLGVTLPLFNLVSACDSDKEAKNHLSNKSITHLATKTEINIS